MISLELGIPQPRLPIDSTLLKIDYQNDFAHKASPCQRFLESNQIQRDRLPEASQLKEADIKPVIHTVEPFTGVACESQVLQPPGHLCEMQTLSLYPERF